MKSSYTKRALAFWLAVAMVATSAPMAFATTSTSPTSTITETSGAGPFEPEKKSLESAVVALEFTSHAYTGAEIKPKVKTVTVDNIQLEEKTDYTVSYSDNTNAGTAKVTITGARNYTGTKEETFQIQPVDLKSMSVSSVSVKKNAGVEAVKTALESAIQATGIKDETVKGTVEITEATRTGDLPEAMSLSVADFTTTGGKYTVKGTFTPEGGNYKAKTFETTCDVTGTTEMKLTFGHESITKTYGTDHNFTEVVQVSGSDTYGQITYTSSKPEVAEVDSKTGEVTIKNAGTTTITANMQGTQTTTAASESYTLTVNKATHPKVEVEDSVFANQAKSYTFDLPQEVRELPGVTYGQVEKSGDLISAASIANQKLSVTVTSQSADTTGTVTIPVNSTNYAQFNLVYTLKAVNKTDVSSNITFADKTEYYTGKAIQLSTPSISGISASGTAKWTYTWSKDGVQATSSGSETMPSFTEVGTYRVTATYEDDANLGRKTATLTIKPATTSIISLYDVSQISSSRDDNYRYFDVDMGTPRDNYVRVSVDADDDLDKQRVDGTSSEWIGLVLEPTQDGTKKTSGLYVSDDKKEWTSLRDDIRMGDFYIDDVDSTSFELWYDTDDRDCSKSLYLATDTNGSNLFEIDVDFDSYSGSSSSSSGSSSSDTSKKDGDRVSTTTIDKTPSVKSRSATVTFSSSAMSDALDENKREARHEDADVTYIELDARTSKTVDDTTITVPRKSLDNIADEDTGLILTTNHGTFTFDDRALAEIYDTCDKTNIDFYIEEEDDDQYIVLIKDGSDDVIDLGSGEVEIVFDYRLKSGEKSSDVNVYRIGDGDKEFDYARDMKADYSSSKKEATFTTDTLGTFLVTTDTLKTGSDSSTTTTPPTTPSYSRFVDVPSSRWSATYINKLASLGIINGTGGGYFEPTLQVTREEFVKMLAGVAGANVTGYTSSRFPDVPMSRWSASYIAWAADRGITTGTDGGRFAPTMKITREEMATMIYRYVQISGKTLPAKNAPVTFADADQISSWAQTAVSVMQQAGIIDGNVTNGRYTFDPKVPASREECAKMLSILYDLL